MYYTLKSREFYCLLLAQFLSAVGDNAIFIAAIALIKQSSSHPAFWGALLQASFLIAYIILAPYVGPLADGCAKSRVMLFSNALKFFGAVAMFYGFDPLLCYAVIGVGAAAYSPAKYGILIEMFPASLLVRANGYLEGSTIVAILLGVTIAGKMADISLIFLFFFCALLYFAAGVINLFIPKIQPLHTFSLLQLKTYTLQFWGKFTYFIRQTPARFSLMGTTTFWSVGTSLRLILFAWIPFIFFKENNALPSTLMGTLSIGIVAGALLAGQWIDLSHVKRVLLPGFFLGLLVSSIVFIHHLWILFLLMIAIGFCGGLFAVPLNALLQDVGHKTVGAGVALAFQNFCENSGMLAFTLVYSLLLQLHLPLPWIVFTLGLVMISVVGMLSFKSYTAA
ncbi:MAG: major facilitator superfamily 1 [Gammaproteobacteria bacterium]|jgi:LPLT family lysophospholipid transporter-like MFS transporter|nr:major facilitator superfamily 1 [Gammaproteobacteria bacterium]